MSNKIKNEQLRIISNFDINNNRLLNVTDPLDDLDGANKGYVDHNAVNYALGTGLYSGGTVTVVDDTTFSISAGIGFFVDQVTKEITQVTWDEFTGVTIMAFGPTDITVSLGIDINGDVYQQIPKFTTTQRSEYIVFGELMIHPLDRVLCRVAYFPILSRDLPSIVDFHLATGPLLTEGNTVIPNGANLSLDVTAGKIVGYSVNAKQSLYLPNESEQSLVTGVTWFTTRDNGTEWVYETSGNTIDPTEWSNGTSTLQTAIPSKYNLRVLYRCAGITEHFFLALPTQLGQYDNIEEAESNLNALTVPIPDEIKGITVPLAWIIVRGNATDLSDSVEAKIIPIQSTSTTTGSLATTATNVSFDPTLATDLISGNVQDALVAINNKIEDLDFSYLNDDMNALSGTSGIYLATNDTVVDEPFTIVRVTVNGLKASVGNGTTLSDCFFSDDSGATAKTYQTVAIGDELYWNGDVAKYQLDITDQIDFIYMTR